MMKKIKLEIDQIHPHSPRKVKVPLERVGQRGRSEATWPHLAGVNWCYSILWGKRNFIFREGKGKVEGSKSGEVEMEKRWGGVNGEEMLEEEVEGWRNRRVERWWSDGGREKWSDWCEVIVLWDGDQLRSDGVVVIGRWSGADGKGEKWWSIRI